MNEKVQKWKCFGWRICLFWAQEIRFDEYSSRFKSERYFKWIFLEYPECLNWTDSSLDLQNNLSFEQFVNFFFFVGPDSDSKLG